MAVMSGKKFVSSAQLGASKETRLEQSMLREAMYGRFSNTLVNSSKDKKASKSGSSGGKKK